MASGIYGAGGVASQDEKVYVGGGRPQSKMYVGVGNRRVVPRRAEYADGCASFAAPKYGAKAARVEQVHLAGAGRFAAGTASTAPV